MSTRRRTLGVYQQKRPLGPNGERLCYNCRGLLPKGRTYNCSPKCSNEWMARTSPSYMRQLVHQRDHGICAECGLDCDALKREYDAIHRIDANGRRAFLEVHGIPRGRSCSDFWDADHIVPVIEGGGECTLENYRTLCIPCHKKATKALRERLSAKRSEDKQANARALLSQPLEFGNLEQKKAARLLAAVRKSEGKSEGERKTAGLFFASGL